MKLDLRRDLYEVIEDFLEPRRAAALADEFRAYVTRTEPDYDGQCPASPAAYNFVPFVELLLEMLPRMEDLTGTRLFPTYCYARSYVAGQDLPAHKDRAASEVSVTVNLGGDAEWPIWFAHPRLGARRVVLAPGQGALYLGCELTHWREPYPGRSHQQVFLHYVRSRGKFAHACFDTRTPEINGIRF